MSSYRGGKDEQLKCSVSSAYQTWSYLDPFVAGQIDSTYCQY
jgi:hypothetical protein